MCFVLFVCVRGVWWIGVTPAAACQSTLLRSCCLLLTNVWAFPLLCGECRSVSSPDSYLHVTFSVSSHLFLGHHPSFRGATCPSHTSLFTAQCTVTSALLKHCQLPAHGSSLSCVLNNLPFTQPSKALVPPSSPTTVVCKLLFFDPPDSYSASVIICSFLIIDSLWPRSWQGGCRTAAATWFGGPWFSASAGAFSAASSPSGLWGLHISPPSLCKDCWEGRNNPKFESDESKDLAIQQ